MTRRYPQYFDPPNPLANQMAGCGAYSSHAEINEVERLMQMAFRVNWKASFDFPYMGMFIPPVASDTEEWTDFMNQKISIAKMRDSAAPAAVGFLSAELLQRHRVRRGRKFRPRRARPPRMKISGKTRTIFCIMRWARRFCRSTGINRSSPGKVAW